MRLTHWHAMQTPYTAESASYCAERNKWAAGGDDMWVHLYDYNTGDELDVNKGRLPASVF